MCRRNNLVHRRVTSFGQKVPKNAVEIAEQSLEDMKNIDEFANLANMNETPCFTVALTAGVKKTENRFTPFRLSPLLIFKNLVKAPPGKYPMGMAVLGSKRGGDNEIFLDLRNLRETYLEKKVRWVF